MNEKSEFEQKFFIQAKIYSADFAELPSVRLDVNFADTLFSMEIKVFKTFSGLKERKIFGF